MDYEHVFSLQTPALHQTKHRWSQRGPKNSFQHHLLCRWGIERGRNTCIPPAVYMALILPLETRSPCFIFDHLIIKVLLIIIDFSLLSLPFCSPSLALEFELRALHLLGRCSTTWATLPALFCLRPASDHSFPSYASRVAGITVVPYHTWP
jgi:hypothetical protein